MADVEIILDSITDNGCRLTTFRINFWKILLAELNTHRALSRCSASSRAVPAKVMRDRVINNPFIPIYWGQNQKGMQADKELPEDKIAQAIEIWLEAAKCAAHYHTELEIIGVHKQVCNRLLEPWLTSQVIVSGTEWRNFFRLRDHKDAQPEFQVRAAEMHRLYKESTPQYLAPGEYHLPFIRDEEQGYPLYTKLRVSASRCARSSYFKGGSEYSQVDEDMELFGRLSGDPPHVSPTEHQAEALKTRERCGNFVGWRQFRKDIPNESGGDYFDPSQTLLTKPTPADGEGMHDLIVQHDLPLFRERYPEKIDIIDRIEEDLLARKKFGLEKYGTILKADNGRCPFLDAYHEALDAIAYLKQGELIAPLESKLEVRYLKEIQIAAAMRLRTLVKEVHHV
ncbi:MAG: FAD-dependent thymidylate synthase [Desertifilum sp.]|nr:FAD-dependent thymidylate synthase [Desertifilum sp.]